MFRAGIIAIGSTDEAYVWSGGQYYLQHLVKCVASLPANQRAELSDVWWLEPSKVDPFKEVRPLLGDSVIIAPPTTVWRRLVRWLRRLVNPSVGAADLFRQAGIDVFFPAPPCENAGVPFVYWIPDFQHIRRPDLMDEKMRGRFERDIDRCVPLASQIVLSSFDAQRDFGGLFPQLLDRTHVVRFCSVPDESWWRADPTTTAEKYRLPSRFLIVCNQFTRHKNHLMLVEAIRLLKDRGHRDVHLVCTGSTFDYREEDYVGQVETYLRSNGLSGQVSILGLIPRSDQIALLRRSVAVVQPSLFEGWSTLVEDAKTLGKEILVSDLPVHREQLGDGHLWYLNPDNPQDWAQAIESTWGVLQPGPSARYEKSGMARTEVAKRECGLAFVDALRAALPAGHPG
jgi:glycosyltransferase involved in cell wall biosynthesis